MEAVLFVAAFSFALFILGAIADGSLKLKEKFRGTDDH